MAADIDGRGHFFKTSRYNQRLIKQEQSNERSR